MASHPVSRAPTRMNQLSFPYMFWARHKSQRTNHPLSQSGMPTASPEALQLAPDPAADLEHPMLYGERLEARISEHLDVAPEQVIVTAGATGALHLAAASFFPDSHVVTELPSYNPFLALAQLYARSNTPVQRHLEEGFGLSIEAVERALYARRPKAHLFLCNPHNPTGVCLSKDTMIALAERAQGTEGVLIACETYMEFAPPGERDYIAKLSPNGVSLGSLTKAYGLGPLRIGWMCLGEGLVQRRKQILDRLYLSAVDVPTSALRAGLRAFERLETLSEPILGVEETRRLFAEWMETEERIEGILPRYSIAAFPKVHGIQDTESFSEYLCENHDVDVIPGECFSMPGHLRIGFGIPRSTLERGLEKLSAGIRSYRE